MDYRKVESVVCACVNDVMARRVADFQCSVRPDTMYEGNTKQPMGVNIARQFTYWLLHDMYHVAYSVISAHADKSQRSVIGGVRKVREMVLFDGLYVDILSEIRERLRF